MTTLDAVLAKPNAFIVVHSKAQAERLEEALRAKGSGPVHAYYDTFWNYPFENVSNPNESNPVCYLPYKGYTTPLNLIKDDPTFSRFDFSDIADFKTKEVSEKMNMDTMGGILYTNPTAANSLNLAANSLNLDRSAARVSGTPGESSADDAAHEKQKKLNESFEKQADRLPSTRKAVFYGKVAGLQSEVILTKFTEARKNEIVAPQWISYVVAPDGAPAYKPEIGKPLPEGYTCITSVRLIAANGDPVVVQVRLGANEPYDPSEAVLHAIAKYLYGSHKNFVKAVSEADVIGNEATLEATQAEAKAKAAKAQADAEAKARARAEADAVWKKAQDILREKAAKKLAKQLAKIKK